RLAVLGPVSAGLDLDLLNELEGEVRAGAAECRVAGGDAVQDAVVFRARDRLAVLGPVSAGLDLDLLNELEGEVRAGAAECRVAGGDAVQDVVVFRARRAADRRVTVAPRSAAPSRA